MSHANHAIVVETPDGTSASVVLRRGVRQNWRTTDPDFTPEQEIATYSLLAASAVPAPRLIAADPLGAECDVAAILLTRSLGHHVIDPTDRNAFARELAGVLPAIHRVDPATARLAVPRYRPYADPATLRPPAWTTRPELWERAVDVVAGPPPASRETFIHRDYHPGNTLWTDGRVSAVLDWTTASFGPPGIDLAHMQANLAMLYEVAMADAFLRSYEASAGLEARNDHDPFWDLQDAVGFLGDLADTPSLPPIGVAAPRLEAYVELALAALGR
jgi:aminoglycoside phosphotransferase (APT) family kinase protein